ncbi:Heat shock protein [Trichostrongylus colubriformis]|uniref:Heat shock protein n=1 Tax=Trichostrongylus colubriformis TaxID=6319 RepID=A0AAN8F4Y0_TRICO
MALWPTRRVGNLMHDIERDMVDPFRLMRDMDRFERQIERRMEREMQHCLGEDHSILRIANDAHEVVNDDKKFAVALDVSQFKPEELKVHIDGRDLTIEGRQEMKTDHGFTERSFVRKWALPDDVDLDAVHTQLMDGGKLEIEAPKTGEHTNRRTLPIMGATKKK